MNFFHYWCRQKTCFVIWNLKKRKQSEFICKAQFSKKTIHGALLELNLESAIGSLRSRSRLCSFYPDSRTFSVVTWMYDCFVQTRISQARLWLLRCSLKPLPITLDLQLVCTVRWKVGVSEASLKLASPLNVEAFKMACSETGRWTVKIRYSNGQWIYKYTFFCPRTRYIVNLFKLLGVCGDCKTWKYLMPLWF